MQIKDKELVSAYLEERGYREIKLEYQSHFEDAVAKILEAQKNELKAYIIFNNHAYFTGSLTEDNIYLDYWGCTKKDHQYSQILFNVNPDYRHVYEHFLDRYLSESREKGIMPTKPENIIAALKFIAENHNNDNGIVVSKALIDYGFNFESYDYRQEYKASKNNGKRDINMITALNIIERYRESLLYSRAIAKALLENDDENSLYGFIRHLTGDETYTKEYADKVRATSDIAKLNGEALYEMFTGKTKPEFEEYCKQREADYVSGKSDIMNATELEESREKGIMPITMENVLSALKFIAENVDKKSIYNFEVADELVELGYNFKLDDIKGKYNEHDSVYQGIKFGKIEAAVYVIQQFRDSVTGNAMVKETLLDTDSDMSIYHFIRVTTGDESYTKEYVDSLKNVGKGTK